MLTVGDHFPQFSAQACVGTGKDDLKVVKNADWAGKWVVYFFYPKDFTFVCPTELAEFNKQLKAFADRDCAVAGDALADLGQAVGHLLGVFDWLESAVVAAARDLEKVARQEGR